MIREAMQQLRERLTPDRAEFLLATAEAKLRACDDEIAELIRQQVQAVSRAGALNHSLRELDAFSGPTSAGAGAD